jgi:SPP1 gp7 family putative phage head morphogenesis protein
MTHQKDLEQLETKRKKKLEILLLGILLSASSEEELISKIKKSSTIILEEIKDIRKSSYAIADKYSEDTHRAKDKERQLIIVAAALYLSSSIARRVAISNKESYTSKAIDALEQSKPVINRLVNTEIYEANLKKMVSNNKNEKLRWVAINDKRTCAQCSSLDGKTFIAQDAPDYPHVGCRCFCEVISQ